MSDGVRADEMKFGRACLVPATMLPWSHTPYSKEQDQRLNRQNAQHFQYANGYQYDWYGFDYGAVIGSFDGVKWFAIGSNRRIKAESNKMFIAVNGIFGDLAVENTYTVTINDSLLNPIGSNMVTSDYANDGAQCQQYHQCSTDNDCATTLGWEYACAPVSEITTSWPKFDENAKEVADSSNDKTSLTAILNVSSTGKRCVYRGRGALCTPAYTSVNVNSTFNKTTNPAMHGCAENSYCQPLNTDGVASAKFNNRISRYGKVRSDSTVDTFGLGAIIAGRPYAFNPVETPRAEIMKNLNSNKIQGLCLPGRNVEQDSFLEQNRSIPTAKSEFNGDKVLGIGMTYRKSTNTPTDSYLDACSIMDSSKNFYRNTTVSSSSSFSNASVYPNLKYDAGSQAISTNALSKIDALFTKKGMTLGIYKPNSVLLTSQAFTESRCMRAPGASCFTDQECAPSKIITDKTKLLNADDSTLISDLNKYEIKFWQEDLVCSQAVAKTSTSYDPKNNRCCRAAGNVISIPSADTSNGINYKLAPGIDISMASVSRYSRAATMYKENNLDSSTYPELRTAVNNQCSGGSCPNVTTLNNQFRTLASMAEKTSCTGDWVRSFTNGTHKWEVSRMQTYTTSMFQCLNWYPGTGGYTCAGYDADDPNCPIVQTSPTSTKGKDVLDYLGRLELLGIPQIALESENYYKTNIEQGFSCKSYPGNRAADYPTYTTLPGHNPAVTYYPPAQLFPTTSTVGEYTDINGLKWLSAADPANFGTLGASAAKQIFKSDEVVSCMPAGTQMKASDDPALCCTGTINATTLKCQLNDYIDLSVYTNRYVSSEAKSLSPTLFDKSGYIKDASAVTILACQKSMCSSGIIAYGVLISRLKTPGQSQAAETSKIYRFLENNSSVDNLNRVLDIFNQGLKLNNHAYCVPKALQESATSAGSTDITFVSCN